MLKFLVLINIFLFLSTKLIYANKNLEIFTIHTGNNKATFFKVGRSICNIFNKNYLSYGYLCKVLEGSGSVDNLYKTIKGKADFAITKPLSTSYKYSLVELKRSNELKINGL